METSRQTLAQFIALTNLSMVVEPSPSNPHMGDDVTTKMDHWFYTLKTARRQMSGYFSMGIGHRTYSPTEARKQGIFNDHKFKKGDQVPSRFVVADQHYAAAFIPTPPTIGAVLSCLTMDALGIDNASSFEEWAGEYGLDTDSRKAEKTYQETARVASKLRAMLGNEWYQMLLYSTDVED